jgi:transcriptional regulator with XRE-family HTH domain
MEDAGQKLRQTRERLGLKFRDIQDASQKIADKYHNDDFIVHASRLSDIENKDVVPSLHRLYSLCAIYRLDYEEVLGWYGISLPAMVSDGQSAEAPRTHVLRTGPGRLGNVLFPLSLDPGFDPARTSFFTRMIEIWGKIPLLLLDSLDLSVGHHYGFIGTDDWFMYPLLRPGTFVVIDETKRRIANSGWTSELERPVYFIEHRSGYYCGWCVQDGERVIVMPHPASGSLPITFNASEVDIIGQVTAVAMPLSQPENRRPPAAGD